MLIPLQLSFFLAFSTFIFLLVLVLVTVVYSRHHLRGILNTRHAEYAALAATEMERVTINIANELIALAYSHQIVSAVWSFNDGGSMDQYKRQMMSDVEGWLDSTYPQAIIIYGMDDNHNPIALLNYTQPDSNMTMSTLWPNLPLTSKFNETVSSIHSYGTSVSWPIQYDENDLNSPAIFSVTVPIKAHQVVGSQIKNRVNIGYLTVILRAADAYPAAGTVFKEDNISAVYLVRDDVKSNFRFWLNPNNVTSLNESLSESAFPALKSARKLYSHSLHPNSSTTSTNLESRSALAYKASESKTNTLVPGMGKVNLGYSFANILGNPVYVFLVVKIHNDHYLEIHLQDILIGVAAGIFGCLLLLILPTSWLVTRPFHHIRDGMKFTMSPKDPKNSFNDGEETPVSIPLHISSLSRPWRDELDELIDAYNTMVDKLNKYYFSLDDEVRKHTEVAQEARISAEVANRAKASFIANISHELRSPLNGIMGMTSISMDEKDLNRIRASLYVIIESGRNLMVLLDDLLGYTKGHIEVKATLNEFTPRHFLNTIVTADIRSKNLRIVEACTPDTISDQNIRGDLDRAVDICNRLMSNAVKFCDSGRISVEFRLKASLDDPYICFDLYEHAIDADHVVRAIGEVIITDTGAGITRGQLCQIFDPLFQGDESLSKSHRGAGLGMSMAKKIAQAIGAYIIVYSEESIGTTAILRFPVFCSKTLLSEKCFFENLPFSFPSEEMWYVISTQPGQVFRAQGLNISPHLSTSSTSLSDPDKPSAHALEGVISIIDDKLPNNKAQPTIKPSCSRILVADDNALNLHVLTTMLLQLGIKEIDSAASGEEVIGLVEESLDSKSCYDMIFLDVQMVGMNGLDAASSLRETFCYRGPIIAVTGYSDAETIEKCKINFNEIIVKPIEKGRLKEILLRYLL